MKTFLKQYAGVLAGAAYALLMRLVFNMGDDLDDTFSLFSFTFIWIVPVIIGLVPLFFASREQVGSWTYRVSGPVWTVVVFFIVCFLTRIEDLICIWILLIPYMLTALMAGLIAGGLIARRKNRNRTLYSLLFIPFIASPLEQQLGEPVHAYGVVTHVVIGTGAEQVWENIIRVREISEAEYSKGFFNYAGIPRPLYAELDRDTVGATRTGYFEGGLKFIEKVSTWDRNKEIAFNITVVPSTIRQTVFDQHVLKGGHLRFLNATYKLSELPNGQTELTLTSSYELKTNINGYAAWCGNQLLTDFQERLLQVIKARCEQDKKL